MAQYPSTTSEPPISTSLVTSVTSVTTTPVDVTRLIYMLYQDVEQQISRVDFKAQITLSTSAILAAVMSSQGLAAKGWRMADAHGVDLVALVVWIASAIFLCFAIGYALHAAFPRSLRNTSTLVGNPNLYFSGYIVQLSPEDYARSFCAQSNNDVKVSVLQQIHVKSRVLETKLRSVRLGLRMLVMALSCWAFARLIMIVGTATLGG
ncbi:MAG TPA: Pycsar system effector family protein [Lacunisphaera sp.]|nr:Pycsar system effector family protein [Lacunisphaera sp.]